VALAGRSLARLVEQSHLWMGGFLDRSQRQEIQGSGKPNFHFCSKPNLVSDLVEVPTDGATKMTVLRNNDQKRTLMPPLATILCCVLEDSATLRFGLPDTKSRTSPRKPKNRNSR
jgi:hypothetical protein